VASSSPDHSMRKHTILFLAADPRGTDRLALDREARAVQVELERSGYRDYFDFATRWALEPMDLLRDLRKLKPTVVHYSGHGTRDGLLLHAVDGRAQVVPTVAIAQTIDAIGKPVKLVVLNACYSDERAEALLSHVDCVVGMRGPVVDDAARAFAIGFYGGLGERESVAAAFKQGCAAISLAGAPVRADLCLRDVGERDHGRLAASDRPRLRVRDGVDATRLVLGSGLPVAGLERPTADRAVRSTRRRSVALTMSAAVVVSGFYVAMRVERADPASRPDESRGSERARQGKPPPGMARLPALELDVGSTDGEIEQAHAWCRKLPRTSCRAELYERERPMHRVRLSAVEIDVREASTGDVARWLSRVPGRRLEKGWLTVGGLRLAEVGEDRDLRMRGAAVVPRPGSEDLPAVYVTYDGARRFCQSRGMDLPTEAQWERAARGPERRRFSWGDADPTCDRAVYGRGPGGPCPQGGRAPVHADTADATPEGILHLSGNVAEWVLDRYVEGGYIGCPVSCTDPMVAPTGEAHELHVIRGGAFESLAEQLRGAGRARALRGATFGNTGFRCARRAEERQP
jgi:formylglycine-generating enzyme required for sulfatase activity